jgi:hypothetical protein
VINAPSGPISGAPTVPPDHAFRAASRVDADEAPKWNMSYASTVRDTSPAWSQFEETEALREKIRQQQCQMNA